MAMARRTSSEETRTSRKEPSMRKARPVVALLVALVIATFVGHAQFGPEDETSAETRWLTFAERLRFCLSIASFAVYAPTVADLRLQAQQLVNLLEGTDGRHYFRATEPDEAFSGLLSEVAQLTKGLPNHLVEREVRLRVGAATKNVAVYLELALDAALSSLRERRLDQASKEMLRVYAYLAAAYERPCEIPLVPGLWTVLRALGLAERIERETVDDRAGG
jgi:hypothetical protein